VIKQVSQNTSVTPTFWAPGRAGLSEADERNGSYFPLDPRMGIVEPLALGLLPIGFRNTVTVLILKPSLDVEHRPRTNALKTVQKEATLSTKTVHEFFVQTLPSYLILRAGQI